MEGCETIIQVLLVEDLALFRDALGAVLNGQPDLALQAAIQCDEAVTAAARRLHPDIAVIDIDTPTTCGMDTLRDLHANLAGTRVIALAAASSSRLRAVLRDDIPGVVDKTISAQRLILAVRRVAHGERVIDIDLSGNILKPDFTPLTEREQQVLWLAAEGISNHEISRALCLSPGTVRNYLSRIIMKTGARNRIDAIRIARLSGWL